MHNATKFGIGQVVHHRKFHYRGVIVDVDPTFQGSEQWYRAVARTRPTRNQPWYYVLVDGAPYSTYVAERHLEPDDTGEQIEHPALEQFFDLFAEGRYRAHRRVH